MTETPMRLLSCESYQPIDDGRHGYCTTNQSTKGPKGESASTTPGDGPSKQLAPVPQGRIQQQQEFDMETSGNMRRGGEAGEAGGLSLGALLAIALCGGVFLFTSIGLLMAWVIKNRQKKSSARVYTIPDEYSQTRLTKRPLLMTESAVSGFSSRFSTRLSSRLSLTLPPIVPLPPMPSYSNFSFFRTPSKKRKRADRRSWVRGDDFHGPQVNRDAKGGWFSRDSWFGQAPTVPNLDAVEQGGGEYEKTAKQVHVRPEQFRQPYYEEYRKKQQQSYGHAHDGHQKQHSEPQQPNPQHRQELRVQKRREGNTIQSSQTTPNLASQDDAPRGRQSAVRAPAQAHVRPSITMTELGLRDILRSTDQRLREGASRSPVKSTPHGSPARGSPAKTPRGRRSSSTRGTGRRQSRGTPSPHKGGQLGTSSTQDSITSIGSAANSLIAEATQQLELPGGMASPSRLRGREWEPRGNQILPPSGPGLESPLHTPSHSPERGLQRSPQHNWEQQRSPKRRSSIDSDQSSSLSTLYSVGEPENKEVEEEEEEEIQRQYRLQQEDYRRMELEKRFEAGRDDPFVEAIPAQPSSMHKSKEQPAGPRPLRHVKSMSPSHLATQKNESPIINQPLRPISANPKGGLVGRGVDLRMEPPRRMVFLQLQPPHQMQQSDHVRPKGPKGEQEHERKDMDMAQSASESSFTSASVHSQDSDATTLPACETPKAEWVAGSDGSPSPTASPLTPTRKEEKPIDMSSSPFSEEELLSMLLSNEAKRRALPQPPRATVAAPDGSIMPTGLSPRPSVRGTNRSARDAPALSMTIGELRRMNSVVSSYSAASMASTVVAERDADSPTLPAIFGGNVVPPRHVPKPSAIGSRHYLNIGKAGSAQKPKSMMNLRKTSSASSRNKRPQSNGLPRPSSSVKERGKENQGLGINQGAAQEGLPRPRQVRQTPIPSSPKDTSMSKTKFASPAGSPPTQKGGRAKQGPAAALIAQERRAGCRDSVESLGLYDKDGFLLPSPDREAREMRKKGRRM